MVLQNYENFIEMTSNLIHIVAFGGGLKFLCKIHFNTQCFILSCLLNFFDPLENHGLNSWNLTVCYTDWRRNNLYVKMQTMEEKGKCLAVWGTWILYTTRTYGYKTPCMYPRTTDTQWRHKSKISEKLGRSGRQNMLRPYLKIWEWEWIFGRAVKAFSSLGVRSPCLEPSLQGLIFREVHVI